MNLSPELMSGLRDVSYKEPTELQRTVIPLVLEGKDLLIKAVSQKDKTGSYIIPTLELLVRSKKEVPQVDSKSEGAPGSPGETNAKGEHGQDDDKEEKQAGGEVEQKDSGSDGVDEEKGEAEGKDNSEGAGSSDAGQVQGTQVLIVTPHPEDAQQIDELVWAMGYHAQIECATVGLDGDWDEQAKALNDGVPVIVANPGRLLEILEKNRFVFRHLDMVVIDKAEEMASLNLMPKLDDIFKRIVTGHQTLIYAKEFGDDVKSLVEKIQDEPTIVGFKMISSNGRMSGEPLKKTDEPPKVTGALKQGYIKVPNRMKISTLVAHINNTPTDTCVIFTASKRGTDRLYRVLRKRNYSATSIHGQLSDEKRNQRFANFTNGDVQFLLVADISAADLELNNLQQVINYDVPNDPDEYRYRAGLVGSGKAGRIVSLVSKQDRSDINQLKNELGEAPSELPLPDEVKQKLKQRRNKKQNRGKSKGGSGGNNRGKGRGRSSGKSKSRGSKKKRPRPKKSRTKKDDELQLPRPSYDKLSGGRSGKKEEKGVVGFFKKLFK